MSIFGSQGYNVTDYRTFKYWRIYMPTELGSKIKELRGKKGYTLEKLAELTASSKSYIWELENKPQPKPSADKISKIAKTLEVTIEYLIGNEKNISVEDATDAVFYRKYQKMDDKTKEKIRSFMDLWDDDDD